MYAICVWGDADNQTDTTAHESAFGWQQVKHSIETWAPMLEFQPALLPNYYLNELVAGEFYLVPVI